MVRILCHEIRGLLGGRVLLDVFYHEDDRHLRKREWTGYPNGYWQSVLIALSKTRRVINHLGLDRETS